MTFRRCTGWWEQDGLGRQPMDPLALAVGGGRVRGSGADVVGTFTLAGLAVPNGPVRMVKRYTWRHWVWYAGHYDGVGRMWGQWRVWAGRGPWEIAVVQVAEAEVAAEAVAAVGGRQEAVW